MLYLVTSRALLSSFELASDRAYFSRPVLVEPIYSELGSRLVFCRDVEPRPHVGARLYPVDPRHLVRAERLTKSQRKAAGLPDRRLALGARAFTR